MILGKSEEEAIIIDPIRESDKTKHECKEIIMNENNND